MQLTLLFQILHETLTTLTTIVRSVFKTSLEVAEKASKELQDTPVPPLRQAATFYDHPWAWKTQNRRPSYRLKLHM